MNSNQTWLPATVPTLIRQSADDCVIESIAFSPGGDRLAALSSKGDVTLWDLTSAQAIGEVEGQGKVAFSPDGTLLATGVGESACLYETETWRRVREFGHQGHPVNCVAFAPSGNVLAVGDYRKFVLWDATGGKRLTQIRALDRVVQVLVFSPNGKVLASRSFDEMKFWDLTTGHPLCAIADLHGPSCDICFAPNGRSIISGRDKTSLARWTLNGRPRGVFRDPRAEGYFLSAYYSPDGTCVAVGGQDNMVHLWNANTRVLQRSLSGPVNWVHSIAFSPDGKWLAAAAGPRIHLWMRVADAASPKVKPPRQVVQAAKTQNQRMTKLRSVNGLIARLKKIHWFANVGKPNRHDPSIVRIRDWEEWPGPEDASVADHAARYQSWYDELFVAVRTYDLQEVEKLWKQVEEMTFELARTAVPYDPMADAWIATSQCVHEAAFCAALIACYLKMKWPLPDELVEDWRWYESGHWPCGYGVL
ncbi:MAG TPA: WD40 repeat domain-containing protein [Gemmataceae bacterium]|nr:WD40 repeat domain-containing protein [Gemmataceae bacterium]